MYLESCFSMKFENLFFEKICFLVSVNFIIQKWLSPYNAAHGLMFSLVTGLYFDARSFMLFIISDTKSAPCIVHLPSSQAAFNPSPFYPCYEFSYFETSS